MPRGKRATSDPWHDTGPALPKSETSNFSASQFSCFWPQKPQYTCFFEKGHATNQKKRPLPGKRWTPSSELVFTKNQQIWVFINQSDILPHPHWCQWPYLPTWTTQTPFSIEKYVFLWEMGEKHGITHISFIMGLIMGCNRGSQASTLCSTASCRLSAVVSASVSMAWTRPSREGINLLKIVQK